MDQPQKQHEWLQQLVGEWTWTMNSTTPEGKIEMTGTERVRSIGGMWIVAESNEQGTDGSPMHTVMTVGFDPAKGKYVGSFIGSMMTMMWLYEGELDESQRTLTLRSDGPSFSDPKKTTQYKDIAKIISTDEREFSSVYLADDGSWQPVMTMRYRRVK